MLRLSTSSFCFLSLFVVACGGTDPGEDGDKNTGPLLPFKEGNSWTYRVTDDLGVVTDKVTTIGPLEPIGGTGPHKDSMAHKVITRKQDGTDETVSWQRVEGDRVVRYREIAYAGTGGAVDIEEYWDPGKLRLDGSAARIATGKSWLETYDETKIVAGVEGVPVVTKDLWTVESADEKVEVLGERYDALVVTKVGGSSKKYWFARGIGKVKETGGQTEELLEWTVEP